MNFMGYKRPDGLAGIRNHVLILPTCACASETCRVVSQQVEGSVHIINNSGCGEIKVNEDMTQTILKGFAANPNIYGTVVIGLGCENVSHDKLRDGIKKMTNKPVVSFGIQEEGGTIKTIGLAVKAARQMASEASQLKRESCDISNLILGLECGGSDATSGFAANPALGWVSDKLVGMGASTVMAETIELIGAEHVLAKRGATKEIHDQVITICKNFEEHLAAMGQDCRHGQPTPGNKAGGISTIEEKSLGCIYKGGYSPIVEVVPEGVRPTKKGAIVMDTPGYDIACNTALIAGGCQIITFTTGRGTPTGHAIAPILKITGNRTTYERMRDNLEVDVSALTEGEIGIEEAGKIIFDELLAVLDGKLTLAEVYGFSDTAIDRMCRFI
jgi:altronate dehydratase large subunit